MIYFCLNFNFQTAQIIRDEVEKRGINQDKIRIVALSAMTENNFKESK